VCGYVGCIHGLLPMPRSLTGVPRVTRVLPTADIPSRQAHEVGHGTWICQAAAVRAGHLYCLFSTAKPGEIWASIKGIARLMHNRNVSPTQNVLISCKIAVLGTSYIISSHFLNIKTTCVFANQYPVCCQWWKTRCKSEFSHKTGNED